MTSLFSTAPDLLEDFKQFLPESAAQTRSGGPRPEDGVAMAVTTPTPQPAHVARDGPKMPPVGNFAPPSSASKETKKRPRPDKSSLAAATPSVPEQAPMSALRGVAATAPTSNKRAKLSHKSASVPDGVYVEPTLTPVMPEPLAPIPVSASSQDDFAFFDRVKKHINNRTSMTEFLKLINLWNQGVITKETLLYKANQFMGGNPELVSTLMSMLKYASEEEPTSDNRPEPPTGRVSLSNCRGFGPSYRLLPKRVRSTCPLEICRHQYLSRSVLNPVAVVTSSAIAFSMTNGPPIPRGLRKILALSPIERMVMKKASTVSRKSVTTMISTLRQTRSASSSWSRLHNRCSQWLSPNASTSKCLLDLVVRVPLSISAF